jgi:antitoxin MazE
MFILMVFGRIHMLVKISKWGNSAALRIPKNMLEELSLHIGDKVNLVKKGHTVVIEPCTPSLDDLLAKVNDSNRHTLGFTDQKGDELL